MYVPCVTHKFNAFAGTKATLTLHVAGALAVETCLSFGPWKPRSGPLRFDPASSGARDALAAAPALVAAADAPSRSGTARGTDHTGNE